MADLAWWLANFQVSAFRLETRPAYAVPQEAAMLAAFKRDGALPDMRDHPWVKRVKERCGAGKRMERVRVTSRPMTDYERFEVALYPHSHAAGERIRICDGGQLGEQDFWLFDNHTVVLLHYDAEGTFQGFDVERERIGHYRQLRQLALSRSIPLQEFLATL
jgi:hypothetical protein